MSIVKVEELRELAHGSIDTSYVAVGSHFANPIFILNIVNDTDGGLYISYNGSTDHQRIPAKSSFVWDLNANKDTDNQLVFRASTTVYVKRDAVLSEGAVYVTSVYK